jgi:hypothetical protein
MEFTREPSRNRRVPVADPALLLRKVHERGVTLADAIWARVLSPPTRACLYAGKPVSAGTLRRLDAWLKTKPELEELGGNSHWSYAGLLLANGPDKVRVLLVDLKGGMEFYLFRGLPHLLTSVVSDLPELGPVLTDLLAELERRQAMFAEAGVVSLRHWNARRPADKLPYIVVFVDEFGELSRPVAEASNDSGRGRSPKASAHGAFSRIARLGRALGIRLLACTQRPDADVMPGQIKDQLPTTVAFRTRSETNSHILLGDKDPAAARLPPIKGRAVFQWETEDAVQAPLIEPEAAVALLRAKYAQPVGHGRVTQCPTSPQEIEPGRAA